MVEGPHNMKDFISVTALGKLKTIALKEQVAHRLINKRNIHTKQSKAFP